MRILLNGFQAFVGLLLLTGIVVGQANNPWLSDTERIRFEQLRDSGCEALYNLDYKTARIHFSEIRSPVSSTPRRLTIHGQRAIVRNALQVAPITGLAL